jgi:hypothetical protein
MKYVLYIGEGCHDCHIVQGFIKENTLDVEIIDADEAGDRLQFDIFVRPALMRDDTLVAYGLDVIDHLKNKVMVNS